MSVSSMKKRITAMLLCVLMLCSTSAQAATVLPAGVTVIEEEAFLNDQQLTGLLVLPEGTQQVSADAFTGSGLYALEVPADTVSVSAQTLDCAYAYVHGSATQLDAALIASCRYVFAPAGSAAYVAAGDKAVALEQLVLHEGFYYVVRAGRAALLCARDATAVSGEVTIPEAVDGVYPEEICTDAFFGCGAVTKLNLPRYAAVAEGALANCPDAEVCYYGDERIFMITSIVPDAEGSLYAGSSVTWQVEADYGAEPYRYAYRAYLNGEPLGSRTSFSTAVSYTLTNLQPGEYTLEVSARDADLNVVTLSGGSVTVLPPEVSSLTASIDAPLTEEEVVWTAAITGALDGGMCRVSLYADGSESPLTSADGETLSYTFEKPGAYRVVAEYLAADGTVVDAAELSVTVAYRPVSILSVTPAAEVWYLYHPQTWTVALEGELAPYTLRYQLFCGDELIDSLCTDAPEYTYTPNAAGSYALTVDVVAADETVIATCTLPAQAAAHMPVTADCTVEPDHCYPETDVSFSYALTGLEAHYTATFCIMQGETVIAEESCTAAEALSFVHAFAADGVYQVSLTVRDGEEILCTCENSYTVDMVPLTVLSVSAAPETAYVYDTVTWTTEVTGGVAPYTYAYILCRDGEEIDFIAYGDSATYSYACDQEGDYELTVYVLDAQKTRKIVTAEPLTVTLRTLEIVSAQAAEPAVKLGEGFDLSVEAVGGRLPLSYRYVIGDADSGSTTGASWSGAPSAIGNYTATVTVTDADGTEVSTEITGLRVYETMLLSDLAADVEQIRACNDVTWTVQRTDGRVNCTYTWDILDDGVTEATVETAEPTLVYAPQGMGTYTVTVTAYDGCETRSLTGGAVDVLHRYNTELPYRYGVYAYAINGEYTGTDPYVVIPPVIDGYSINHVYRLSSDVITTLEIGEHISIIYSGSLSCPNLTSITLPKGWSTTDSTDDSMNTYGPFTGCKKLTTITVPEGETYLSRVAFAGTPALRTVNLPSTLTSIGALAFYNCGNLASISIPAGVTSIGSHAFAGTAITHVDLPAGWNAVPSTYGDWYDDFYGSSPFAESNVSSVTLDPAMTAIPNNAFDDATALTTITIHDNITSIGNYAFSNCTGLSMLTIPDSVISIGLNAFSGCNEHFYIRCNPGSYAEEYCIANGVSYVSEYEFTVTNGEVTINKYTGSMEVEQINVPAYIAGYPVTKIEGVNHVEVFPETIIIEPSITFPDTLRTVGSDVFYVCDLTTLDLGSGVTTLYTDFASVHLGVVNLTLPESLTNYVIVSQNFGISIDNLTLPASMTAEQFIALARFLYAYDSITVAGGEHMKVQDNLLMTTDGTTVLRCIGSGDFVIPDTATTIESYAVAGSFHELTIPDSVTTIRSNTFYSLEYVFIHCSATSAAETYAKSKGINTTNHFTYTLADGACTISAYKGPLKAITLPPRISGCPVTDIGNTFQGSAITSINMRDTSITELAACAFQSCRSLTNVTLPLRTLTIIGESAFRGCTALTIFFINNHLTDIGDYAFADCSALSAIDTSSMAGDWTPLQLKRLGSYAFQNCVSLTRFYMYDSITDLGTGVFSDSGLQTVTLSPNLKSIPAYTFYYTDLTKIVIPDSVTSIGNYAFDYTGLTKIWIPGSVTTITTYAFNNLPSDSVTFWLQSTVSSTIFNKLAALSCSYSVGRSSSLPSSF